MLTRIKELAAERSDFGFETTLSGRTYARLLSGMKTAGYRLVLFFLWLPDAELAVARVANRVRQGGHGIPEETIRRRFSRGMHCLFHVYMPIMDHWELYDASRYHPVLVARHADGQQSIYDEETYQAITAIVGGSSG